jgi:hypothetical protein
MKRLIIFLQFFAWHFFSFSQDGKLPIIDLGLGDKLTFGSVQMMWPEKIEVGIKTIQKLDFSLNHKK